MASTEGPARVRDRHARRRPFANWMRRLASLKSLHVDSLHSSTTRPISATAMKGKKIITPNHTPYLISRVEPHLGYSAQLPAQRSRSRHSSLSYGKHSVSISHDSQAHLKSRAPTLATTAETAMSDTAQSGAATTTRTDADRDSTFSSPTTSVRSMTTTLTTLQSTAPTVGAATQSNAPTASTPTYPAQPATAIPAHLAPAQHPVTYHSAIANNVLTDDASVLTLASSSKRRRRNSVDTNASVKALAPTSVFGGSRESLPLSVLSGTVINPGGYADAASIRDTASSYYPRSTSAMNVERASLISASGITAPVLASERNSYISTSKHAGDAGSVRSGLPGHGVNDREGASSRAERLPLHGRNDSLGAGSIGASSLLREKAADRDMVTAPTSPMTIS